jgi:hypothetical protein
MKFSHLKALAAALAASTLLAGSAHAQIVGESTYAAKVNIAASTVNGGPHVSGRVGIGVPNTGLTTLVDFQGLQTVAPPNVTTGVTTVSAVTGTITDHSQFGQFDFAKVSGANVYFGEWTQTGDVTSGDHTVYYGGTDATSAVPETGTAFYAVKGISDYENKSVLQGEFEANFTGGNQGVLTGNVHNAGLTYIVDIGVVAINGGTFAGSTASATGATSSGDVSGRFFGTGGTSLAGIVKFGSADRQYDTAFGGQRTSYTP